MGGQDTGSRLRACAALFVAAWLCGTTGLAGPCPPPRLVDLSGADAFSNDEGLPFRLPLDDWGAHATPFLTNFGAYGNSLAYEGSYHAAEDFTQPAGTPVFAMADGHISFSGPMGGYGWLVVIDHPQANLYSLYGHLSPSRWCKKSGTVRKGELIAYLGDTDENGVSQSNGEIPPHLHFGVRAGQRADYPGIGEWRWQAGWVKPCPQDLGWLQPSAVIAGEAIPVGGFDRPTSWFLATWGGELLFLGVFVLGGACTLVVAIKRDKPLKLVLFGGLMVAAGWLAGRRGMRIGSAQLALGALAAAIGIYRSVRRRTGAASPRS